MRYESVHSPKVRFVYITAKNRLGGDILEQLEYRDLPMKMAIKWGWYFKYRHALLQVKYPKGYIETVHHNIEPEGRSLERIEAERLQRESITCKRMITKITNALSRYEEEQNKTMFPDFDNQYYTKAKIKLHNYKIKLETLSESILQNHG